MQTPSSLPRSMVAPTAAASQPGRAAPRQVTRERYSEPPAPFATSFAIDYVDYDAVPAAPSFLASGLQRAMSVLSQAGQAVGFGAAETAASSVPPRIVARRREAVEDMRQLVEHDLTPTASSGGEAGAHAPQPRCTLRRCQEPSWWLGPLYSAPSIASISAPNATSFNITLQKREPFLALPSTQPFFDITAGKHGNRSAYCPGVQLLPHDNVSAAQLVLGRRGATALFWQGHALTAVHCTKQEEDWAYCVSRAVIDDASYSYLLERPGQASIGLLGSNGDALLFC